MMTNDFIFLGGLPFHCHFRPCEVGNTFGKFEEHMYMYLLNLRGEKDLIRKLTRAILTKNLHPKWHSIIWPLSSCHFYISKLCVLPANRKSWQRQQLLHYFLASTKQLSSSLIGNFIKSEAV